MAKVRERRSARTLRYTAFHEAGHAVAAVVQRQRLVRVSIERNADSGESSEGHAAVPFPPSMGAAYSRAYRRAVRRAQRRRP